MKIRYVDWEARNPLPPAEINQTLNKGERIISVETTKDIFGYAWVRVWILEGESG